MASDIPSPSRLAAFVDVETTGLSTRRDQIVELAIALFRFDPTSGRILEILDEYQGLNEPTIPIPRKATEKHGLHKRMLRGKRLDRSRISDIALRAEILISHNATYDHGFISRVIPMVTSIPWRCSMNQVPWYTMGFQSKGLQQLLTDHGIDPGDSHRAMSDVTAALKLLNTEGADGTRYFKHLIEATPYRFGGAESIPRRTPRRHRAAHDDMRLVVSVSDLTDDEEDADSSSSSIGCYVALWCISLVAILMMAFCAVAFL